MNFYKHFIGDYQRDTAHLSLTEHGAYRLMLDAFYGTARPLPGDKKALYRLIRAETDAEKRAVDSVALQFWQQLPDEWDELFQLLDLRKDEEIKQLGKIAAEWAQPKQLINLRALNEIVRAKVTAEKNRQIAIDREAKKRSSAPGGGAE